MLQEVMSKITYGYSDLPSLKEASQTLHEVSEGIYHQLPSSRQIASNVMKVTNVAAKPFAALMFLDLVTGANGGPLLYAACVADCIAMTLGAGAVGPCEAACLPLLVLPTP